MKKTVLFCCILCVLLALGLASCRGNGNSGTPPNVIPVDTETLDICVVQNGRIVTKPCTVALVPAPVTEQWLRSNGFPASCLLVEFAYTEQFVSENQADCYRVDVEVNGSDYLFFFSPETEDALAAGGEAELYLRAFEMTIRTLHFALMQQFYSQTTG